MDYGLIRTAHPRIIIQSNGVSPPSTGTEVHWHVDVPDDLLFLGENAGNIGVSSGGLSVGIGKNVLQNQTSGDNHTGVGSGALAAATSGGDQTAVGMGAAAAVTTGSRSTAVGVGAYATDTSGNDNTAVGFNALNAPASGGENGTRFNVAVGSQALADGTNFVGSCTAVGANAGQVAGTTAAVASLTLVGVRAGDAIDTGNFNTLAGADVGATLTTGEHNVLVGSFLDVTAAAEADLIAIGDAGSGNAGSRIVVDDGLDGIFMGGRFPGNWPTITGLRSIVFGAGAGIAMTTADDNVVIGEGAAPVMTVGDENVIIGQGAAVALVGAASAGQLNVLIGADVAPSWVGSSGVDHRRSVIIGPQMDSTIVGSTDMIAIGTRLGEAPVVIVDPGNRSIAMGDFDAGNQNTIQLNNVALGHDAGSSMTSVAEDNVYVGSEAGQNNTDGTDNTGIGRAAGDNISTGDDNTFVGNLAGTTTTTGSRNIVVGSGADTPAAGTNDHLNVGDTIFGDLAGNDVRVGGSGAVSQTERLAVTDSHDDTTEVFSLELTGTNGGKTRHHVGDRDPEANVSADPGDLYYQESGTSSHVYLHTGSGTGSAGWGNLAGINNPIVISPAQITVNQNDYSPTGIDGCNIARLDTDASRNITGVDASGLTVRIKRFVNVGSNPVVFTHQDAASAAANRFILPGAASHTMNADEGATFWYDGTTARWRLVANS